MSKELLTGVMIGLAGIVAFITGGIPLTVAAVPLQTVGTWEALGILSNLAAPIIGGIVAVVVWLHKRLNELEDDQEELKKSVFGSDRDALNEGVLLEVRNINQQLSKIQDSIDKLQEENERLRRENDND